MSEQDNARRAPMHYIATARAYCFDLAAMAFLFASASVMAGESGARASRSTRQS